MTSDPFEPVEGPDPAAVPPVVAPSPQRGDRAFRVLLVLAFVVATGGVAFMVGRLTAPAAAATTGRGPGFIDNNGQPNASGFPGANGNGFPVGRGGFGGTSIRGTVESSADGSMTIKLADGSTATIALDGSTTYHRQAAATSADVTAGQEVQVQVQFGGGLGNGNPGASPAASPGPRTFTATDVMVVSP